MFIIKHSHLILRLFPVSVLVCFSQLSEFKAVNDSFQGSLLNSSLVRLHQYHLCLPCVRKYSPNAAAVLQFYFQNASTPTLGRISFHHACFHIPQPPGSSFLKQYFPMFLSQNVYKCACFVGCQGYVEIQRYTYRLPNMKTFSEQKVQPKKNGSQLTSVTYLGECFQYATKDKTQISFICLVGADSCTESFFFSWQYSQNCRFLHFPTSNISLWFKIC